MTPETSPSVPPAERPDDYRSDADPAVRTPLLTGLGTAGSLIFGAVIMLGFGVAWALLFYPPASLAIGGAVVCAAFALAALVQAVREIGRAAHWRRGAV
jgi:hypothetical protein